MPLSSLALGGIAPRPVRGGHSKGICVAAEVRRDAGAGAAEGQSGSSSMLTGERASCNRRAPHLEVSIGYCMPQLC